MIRRKIAANSAMLRKRVAMLRPLKVVLVNRDASNIALSPRRTCRTMNAIRVIAEAAKSPRMNVLVQPLSSPRRSPRTSSVRKVENNAAPIRSSGGVTAERDSVTRMRVIISAMIPSGMLIKKIQRQSRPSVRPPPTSGPAAMARPPTPPKIPKARVRSAPV